MGISATTFDPYGKGSSVTLSGSDLVATVSSGTGGVRASNRISGLSYFEIVIGSTLTGSSRVGVYNPWNANGGVLLGADTAGCGYDSGGTVKINNVTVATLTTFAASDNIGVAVDPFRQLVWFRKNGGNWNNDVIANQNPVGAVGGISLSSIGSVFSPGWAGSATSSATVQFSSGSWSYGAPSGFISLDTLGSFPVGGSVSDRAATYTQYGKVAGLASPSNSNRSSFPASGLYCSYAWYGNSNKYSPASPAKYVSGQVQEAGTPVPGKNVYLYNALTGSLIGSTISDASGNFSINAMGVSATFVVALDGPTYNALIYDNVVPV